MEPASPLPAPYRGRAVALAGPGAVPDGEGPQRGIGVVVVAGGTVRRRSRQAVSRPRVVQFSLTEDEFEEVSRAAERSGLARGAFAAEAALASARGGEARVWSPVREALVEVMAAAGLVRRGRAEPHPAGPPPNGARQGRAGPPPPAP